MTNDRQELMENLLGSLDEGVVILDPHLKVVTVNQAAERMTGAVRDKAGDRPLQEVFKRNQALVSLAARAAAEGKSFVDADGRLVNGSGVWLPVGVTASPLFDSLGTLVGVVLLLRDLSLIRLFEVDLKNRERLAELGVVAAGLAHELKNPLSGIKALLSLLKRQTGDEEKYQEYFARLYREVDRIGEVVAGLLDLGRGEGLNFAIVNLNKVLSEVIGAGRPMAQEKGALISADLDVSLPPIMGDEAKLIHLFQNLMKNSLEAVEDGGQVSVTSRMVTDFHLIRGDSRAEKMTRVEVRDNGVGIPEEELPRIFTPFYTTKRGGSGLGLAICARVVDQHGGAIKVTSEKGEGTVVQVTLPAAVGAAGAC